jgi:hypothetical protein
MIYRLSAVFTIENFVKINIEKKSYSFSSEDLLTYKIIGNKDLLSDSDLFELQIGDFYTLDDTKEYIATAYEKMMIYSFRTSAYFKFKEIGTTNDNGYTRYFKILTEKLPKISYNENVKIISVSAEFCLTTDFKATYSILHNNEEEIINNSFNTPKLIASHITVLELYNLSTVSNDFRTRFLLLLIAIESTIKSRNFKDSPYKEYVEKIIQSLPEDSIEDIENLKSRLGMLKIASIGKTFQLYLDQSLKNYFYLGITPGSFYKLCNDARGKFTHDGEFSLDNLIEGKFRNEIISELTRMVRDLIKVVVFNDS